MKRVTREWVESIGYNKDEIIGYGMKKFNFSESQIEGAIEDLYKIKDQVDPAVFGHLLWDSIGRPETAPAPAETTIVEILMPLLWTIGIGWLLVEVLKVIYVTT